ncbi:hypothetical protein HF086_009535 [Spodoptera exigua]|uniref:Uncharacterized protein n=1 Tax=Spodoptera exigua TaxID=7107 RepID=A0A922SEZ3_SPOEX|nr:hypothetical protein HF086_009535 [Spodoptera exigua]
MRRRGLPPGPSPTRGALWFWRYPWSKFVKILRLGKIFRKVCMYVCITLQSYRRGEDAPFPQYHSHDKATHSCRETRFFITLPQNTKSHLIGKVDAGLLLLGGLQHAAGMASVTAPALRGSGGPTRANRRRWFYAHHRGFGLLAGQAGLSRGGVLYNHQLLSSGAAPPLRAFSNLKNTLGVGQIRDHYHQTLILFLIVTIMERLRCANCTIATQRLKRHVLTGPDYQEILSIIRQWHPNRSIQITDHICDECWVSINNVLYQMGDLQPPVLGHLNVCVNCGRSLNKVRSHALLRRTDRAVRIYNAIAEWILPDQSFTAEYIEDMSAVLKSDSANLDFANIAEMPDHIIIG